MSKIFPGRYTAAFDEPFVVFLLGMRVNRIFAVRKWLQTAQAMVTMLRALKTHPEKGFMGAQTIFYWRGIGLIQYWRSFEDLERVARSPSEPHLEIWRRFNRTIGADGTVGFWHETFMVEPGRHEAIYGNMPVFGLAAATQHVPAVGRRETARQRLGGENEPAVPSPATPGGGGQGRTSGWM
jgi:Monooxygenase af470-like